MALTRRFALLVAVVLVGGVALAGCGRAQPGTAAYVGGHRYTEKQIDDMADDARTADVFEQLPGGRVTLVSWLVMAELGKLAAKDNGIEVPGASYDQTAEQLRLPATSPFVRAWSEWVAVRDALVGGIKVATPSEEQIRDLYNDLSAAGQIPAGMGADEAITRLRQIPDMPAAVALRQFFREAAGKRKVVINPRYRPLIADLDRGLPLVLAVGFGDVVTDLPAATNS